MLSIHVDASHRGRRGQATGLAVILRSQGLVRGRAVMATIAQGGSHHAEAMAAHLGLSLALSLPIGSDADLSEVVLYSDSEGLVHQIKSGLVRTKSKHIIDITNMIQEKINIIVDMGATFKCEHRTVSTDPIMSHADYLSKSITTE